MPWYQFDIELPLPTAEVAARIQSLTREAPAFWQAVREAFGSGGTGQPPFVGRVTASAFRIRRDIRYRNSFLPVIRGDIRPSPSGSVVRVNMTLHPAVAVFMALWLTGVGSISWDLLSHAQGLRDPTRLIPVGMFLFGIALTLGGFIPEAIKAKRLLIGALSPPVTGAAAGRPLS